LEKDKASLTEELRKFQEDMKKQVESLKAELSTTTKTRDQLSNQNIELTAKLEKKTKKYQDLKKEKKSLTKTALDAQAAQKKLKAIVERAPKEEVMAKVVIGDTSFNSVSKTCTKAGVLMKQGGQHTNRWQTRHIVLNDNFLFYFASAGEKEPHGVIRLDAGLTEVSRINLDKLKKEHAFTIVKKDKSARPYFFTAPSEKEADEWVAVIKGAEQTTHFL